MSRVTYADVRLALAELRRLEEERLRREEEARRKAILDELQRLRERLATLTSETAELARHVEKLSAEATGHPVAAPALGTFDQRLRALRDLIAGFPNPEDGADSAALGRTREQAQRILSVAESQLKTLKSLLPTVEEDVAEARRLSFEARVFARTEGETPAPSEPAGEPEERRASSEKAPPASAEALLALAREAAAVREALAELDADLPPEMRPEVEELAREVATLTALRDRPVYAAGQLGELGRKLAGYARRAAQRRQERDRVRATLASRLEELRTLAATGSQATDTREFEAVLAEGVRLSETGWPEPLAVERWLERAESLVSLTRSRLEKEAQRRRVLDLVRDALAELGYEALADPAPARSAADAPLEQVFLSPHGGGVSVSVAGDGALLSEVVRFVEPGSETAEPTPLESEHLDRQTKNWCHDYSVLIARLQEQGVVSLTERWRDESGADHPRAMARPKKPRRKAKTAPRRRRRGAGPATAPGRSRS